LLRLEAVLKTIGQPDIALMTTIASPTYIGRFAPTPSGHLHFGSLVAALASYLDARSVGGRWLVRMEDLDPPREEPGAQAAILKALESYGFEWDGDMVRQSDRHAAYDEVINRLFNQGLAYACTCSRKQLAPYHGIYPGFCRNAGHGTENAAIRLRVPELEYHFIDRVQGEFRQHLGREVGDFVIRRRDGLYAYQLAVVLDDAWQGITDIVRGADLLDSTPRQLYLQELLGLPQPRYLHIPLITQPDGHKLGKSYRSPPLTEDQATPLLLRALRALGHNPATELNDATPRDVLNWGIAHWDASLIPRTLTLPEAQLQ
jgi:glutamyl-Q tRNA(Asp) synthetase